MNHIIHKQELQLTTDSLDKAPEIQESYRQTYWNKLLPRLDEVFSEMSHSNLIWRIEHLELDLGILPPEGFEDVLLSRVENQIRHQLLQMKLDVEQGFSKKHQMSIIKPANWEREVLFHFLEEGQLPWWLPKGSIENFSQTALKTLNEKPDLVIKKLQKNANPNLAKRLKKQMGFSFIEKLISYTQEAVFFRQIKQELKALLVNNGDKSKGISEDELLKIYHNWVIEAGIFDIKTQTQALEVLFKTLEVSLQKKQFFSIDEWKRMKSEAPNLSKWLESSRKGHKNGHEEWPKHAKKDEIVLFNPEKEKIHADVSNTETNLSTKGKLNKTHEINGSDSSIFSPTADNEFTPINLDPRDLAAGIHIENAGLVLLAPFLGGFFRKTDLMQGRGFPTEKQAERAILLTQYLVTKENVHPEYNLVLNKLLCGWPLRKSMDKEFTPSELEETEVTDLLASVIHHWQALGNTKVRGFRTSFLQRQGKLSLQHEGYHLLVARKGIDVLLEKLPWSIGFIRLAWMERPLTVEW